MTDSAFYSREYNNRALVPDNEQWVARWLQGSERARATMTCHLDQRYGEAPGETMDIFPARKGDGSCMMFIHGGYWRSRDKQDFSFLAPAWVDAGVSLAVVNYDLCPAVTVEEIVRQMLRAEPLAVAARRGIRHGRGPALRLRPLRGRAPHGDDDGRASGRRSTRGCRRTCSRAAWRSAASTTCGRWCRWTG